jgi:hypothetical protein
MEKRCDLDDEKFCVDCGECLMCDLDPEKRCDNCMECVKKSDADYATIEIDEVIADTSPKSPDSFAPTLKKPAKSSSVRAVRKRKTRKLL